MGRGEATNRCVDLVFSVRSHDGRRRGLGRRSRGRARERELMPVATENGGSDGCQLLSTRISGVDVGRAISSGARE